MISQILKHPADYYNWLKARRPNIASDLRLLLLLVLTIINIVMLFLILDLFKQEENTITSKNIVTKINKARQSVFIHSLKTEKNLMQSSSAAWNLTCESGRLKHSEKWNATFIDPQNGQTIGENLAQGFATSQDTVDHWLMSDSHRENLLNHNYQYIGVRVGQCYDQFLIVAHFSN